MDFSLVRAQCSMIMMVTVDIMLIRSYNIVAILFVLAGEPTPTVFPSNVDPTTASTNTATKPKPKTTATPERRGKTI